MTVFTRSLEGGGAERVAYLLANEFARSGVGVDLVLQFATGPYLDAVDPSVRILEIGRRLRWSVPWLIRYLRTYRPKAVLGLLTENNVAILLGALLSSYKGRIVVSERNSLRQRRYIPPWIVRPVVRYLYPRADRVVALTNEMADELVALGLHRSKVTVIPNPVSVEHVLAQGGQALDHAFFNAGVPVLVAVGRLVAQKDYPTMLQAAFLLSLDLDFRLLVLGEGEERLRLQQLTDQLGLQGVVDFPGFKSPPWPWMARSDLLVLSSTFEGWGNVVAEALALGLRVVSTDCPTGPREILDDGRFGTLVPVRDPRALADGIISTLAAPKEPERLRRRAREWETERVANMYLELLGVVEC
ncbi:MAG: glycosyltransferase [Acidimicrobiia bacterium]